MADDELVAFAKQLAPQPFDRSTVSERRNSIEEHIKKHTSSAGLVESGSWSHGTAVTGHSDVDYMAFFPDSSRPVRPSTALTNLKGTLDGAHWGITSRHISSPTVKVGFYSVPNFEIVPAYYKGEKDEIAVFRIPGPGDEWAESVPLGHNGFVSAVNDKHGKKVKPIVRLVKAWKYHVGAPVSSFYLEMRTAKHASTESAIIYDIDLRMIFRELVNTGMRAMNDPLGIVPRINATSSEANRVTALRQAKEALDCLVAANEAKEANDRSAYWTSMYRVFGYDFPYPSWG
ncbi:hypothetical protein BCF74_1039 [Knoellia remsis]|uniref:Nucleotidyltransferase-like protein n=1 Tax=Knoellia remsis TaxID=407159 RepID=A0A2T0UXZ5_9MICO|nr:nucleotidyltransferase [Knoellia remsis]PRY62803.1 hypothetical protein BCF74_1039 [Knoellia remsis]